MSILNLPHSGYGQMGDFSKNAVTALGAPKNVPVFSLDKRLLVSKQ
jgi:hypothetical protein